jgi:hypothetical protein
MDMGGTHCLVAGDEGEPTRSYHRDFSHPVALPSGAIGHCDVALDPSGRDVLVYQNVHTDWIAMADLESGAETNLVPIPFGANADIGLHISGNCDTKPGWVLMSTYGSNTAALTWMDRSLFMLELRSGPAVWRVAQTQTLQASADEKDYFAEAFAAVNRAGSRVWWGSNWNAVSAEGVGCDAYYAELPASWEATVPGLAG